MEATIIKGELNSSCICMACLACGIVSEPCEGDKCPECAEVMVYDYDGCDGFCWVYAEQDMHTYFDEWLEANNTEEYAIYGTRMGWRNSSGHTGRLTTWQDLLDNVTFSNGDFIIRWEFDEANKTFTMGRSSHDEYGTMLELRVWKEGDDE